MKRELLLPLPVFVAALFAGIWLARSGNQDIGEPAPAVVAPPKRVEPPALASPRYAWLEALAGSNPSDLPRFYSAASGDPGTQDLVARYWIRTAPASFLEHLLADDPPIFSHPAHAAQLFKDWGKRDPVAAIAAAMSLPAFNPDRDWMLKAVVRSGWDTDPEAMSEALASILSLSGSSGWGAADAASAKAAIPLLAKLPQLGTLEMTLSRNIKLWMADEPDAALEWTREFTRHRTFDYFSPYSRALSEIAEKHPQMAIDAIGTIDSLRERSLLLRSTAYRLAEKHPAATSNLIEENLDGLLLSETASHSAKELAERDPLAGVDYAIGFRDPDARSHAIAASVAQFYKKDREALANWSASIENGGLRDEVAGEIAKLDAREGD